MMQRQALLDYLDTLLTPHAFQDYCPNGLQVAGREEIQSIVSGVTASMALIEAAIAQGADAILVHHGYFWRGESPTITGMKHQRIKALLRHDINLFAYHLPLDAHPVLGNNQQLANLLGWPVDGAIAETGQPPLALWGTLQQPQSVSAMAAHIAHRLGREPITVSGTSRLIHRVGWCTGAAQSMIEAAARSGCDAFISGEISEQTTHQARELGMHYLAAGHHATERYGVKALGEQLATAFGLAHHFVDIDNPV